MKKFNLLNYLSLLTSLVILTACQPFGDNELKDKQESILVEFSFSTYSSPLLQFFTSGVPTVSTTVTLDDCSISPSLPAGLSIDPATCEISGTPTTAVTATYTITATSSGVVGKVDLLIEVLNIAPSINYSNASYSFNLNSAGSTTGIPTNSGGAISACGVTPSLPTGLTINNTSCAISGTPTVVSANTIYNITASNSAGNAVVSSITIGVLNIPPSITYSSANYSFNLNAVSTTGSVTSSAGSISGCSVSPALPIGLTINSTTCVISGTPTVVTAAANYTITPSNTIGSGTARVINIRVLNIAPSIAYSSATFSFDLFEAGSTTGTPINSGGDIEGCIVTPTLPSGLMINNTTCAISGTPTVVTAAANYTITPSNTIGSGTARVINIRVLNIAPSIAYSSATYAFTWNNSSSTTGTPTNTGGAITGCTVSPTLPTGLSINNTNCVISGTPTAATAAANYTITPTNGIGDGADRVISISVTASMITDQAWALYDANNTTSYPTAGDTWYDISGNNRHGSIPFAATPGLTSVGGRSVVLNETNTYEGAFRLESPNADTTYSFQTWMKFYGFVSGTSLLSTINYQALLTLSTSSGPLRAVESFGNTIVSQINSGIWYNVAVTVSGTSVRTYLNGTLVSTSNNGVALNGALLFYGTVGFMNIGDFLVYSKTLSDTEVMQNYQSKILNRTNTPPTPGVANYTYATDLTCEPTPSGITLYSSTPAAVGTVFYLDSDLTIRSGRSLGVNGTDYNIQGNGEAVGVGVYCD